MSIRAHMHVHFGKGEEARAAARAYHELVSAHAPDGVMVRGSFEQTVPLARQNVIWETQSPDGVERPDPVWTLLTRTPIASLARVPPPQLCVVAEFEHDFELFIGSDALYAASFIRAPISIDLYWQNKPDLDDDRQIHLGYAAAHADEQCTLPELVALERQERRAGGNINSAIRRELECLNAAGRRGSTINSYVWGGNWEPPTYLSARTVHRLACGGHSLFLRVHLDPST